MAEQNEEHFEVISENKAREFEKNNSANYKPLPYDLFIEESMINGQGLFASNDIPNCEKIKSRADGAKLEYNLYTRKDIKAGEELTLHYTFYRP